MTCTITENIMAKAQVSLFKTLRLSLYSVEYVNKTLLISYKIYLEQTMSSKGTYFILWPNRNLIKKYYKNMSFKYLYV